MCEFYTRLYRSSNIENANIKSYIEKIKLQNILNEKQKMELDEFPSLKECDEAIKMLKPNKSWLNAGILYVKDLVNENGVKPLNYFSNILTKKHNIYCEYLVIKNCFKGHKN